MTNRSKKLCSILMLCALGSTLFISCQKDIPFSSDEPQTLVESASDDDSTLSRVRLTSTYVRKNLLFDFSTETSSTLINYLQPLNFWHAYTAYSGKAVTRSSYVSRAGSYSVRYELNKTDGMVGGGKRSETYRNPRGETNPKVERWYGASYFLPSDYVYDVAAEIVTQWHTPEYTGSPMLALWTAGGQWKIVQRGKTTTSVGTYDKNKWTDFVFHVKWSSGTDGLIEVWKNGVKVMSKTGPTLFSGATLAPYFRTGLYKWAWNSGSTKVSYTTKRIMFVDEIRVGNNYATYADVKPGN